MLELVKVCTFHSYTLILGFSVFFRRNFTREIRRPILVLLVPFLVMPQQNMDLWHLQQRPNAPNMLYRCLLVDVCTHQVPSHWVRHLSHFFFASQKPDVVRGIAAEINPRPSRRSPCEHIDMAGHMTRRIHKIQAAIAKVV